MSQSPQKSVPSFLAQARLFYADAFAHHRKGELAEAMAEWEDLDDSEQRFTLAHLAYLGLEAQAQTQAMLARTNALLDELSEVFVLFVEASFAENPEAEEDESDEVSDESEALPLNEHAPQPGDDIIDAEPAGEQP